MSVSTIITLGLGTFGSPSDIVRLGYGANATPPVVTPAVTTTPSGVRGPRRLRQYVEIGKRLVEVSGEDEARLLLAELRKEEKKVERKERQLKLQKKKVEVDLRSVGDIRRFADANKKAEKLEQELSAMYARIEELGLLIQLQLEDYEDEEDEWMLLS